MKYLSSKIAVLAIVIFFLQSCSASRSNRSSRVAANENPAVAGKTTRSNTSVPPVTINTKNVDPDAVIDFAETLIGTKYKYGSAIKAQGFDCSGFITYVFQRFKIQVPRVSKDFTNAGYPVPLDASRPGDLILFTGTDTTGWVVGHMGMITANDNGKIKFIHSSSGKSVGVIISPMSKYYATRFVKVIRVFP
jgi:cell wall-associated NlpC family hydrolase